jgi:hypothetical protein
MPDMYFAGAGCADFDVFPLQYFGAAGLMHANRFTHVVISS